ncbi:MAG: hypothetical protein A4E19_19520 [Nitrospira sp. SG-bin1]|nr:MAG: hypothetical protein A4E19_19520 [Nitrospira sp. SG-bin1]
MDPIVSLALMTKAKLMFQGEDTYLAFPSSSLSYKKEDLTFMTGTWTAERLLKLAEFSRIMDSIPSGIALDLTRPDTLSTIYQGVLRGTTSGIKFAVATRVRTSDEEAAYQKAFQFLYTVAPDGSWADSLSAIAYKQYRDAWFAAQEAYKNKEIEATYTTDAAMKERWKTLEEPILRSKVAELEHDWVSKGHRHEYDGARRTYEQFVGSSPAIIWDEWTKQCIPSLDKLTDAVSAQEFFPCGFAPSNVLDSPVWTTLTLTESEVEGLAHAAPHEIRQLLGADQMDLDIQSLSLEISSAVITRAWFAPEVFRARFWKFHDAGKVLSNGQVPASGDCPAYAVAVVFARNLVITLKPQSSKNQQAMTILKTSPALSFATFKLAASPTAPSPGHTVMLKSAVQAPPLMMLKKPGTTSMATGTLEKTQPARSAQFSRMTMDAEPDPLPAGAATRRGVALQRMRGKDFHILPVESVTLPPPPPPTPEVQMPFAKDEVWILGVVCRRLPLCPNPDPTLRWE